MVEREDEQVNTVTVYKKPMKGVARKRRKKRPASNLKGIKERVVAVATRMGVTLPPLKGRPFGRGVEIGETVILSRQRARYGSGESWTVRRCGSNASLVGLSLPDALMEVQYMLKQQGKVTLR